MTVFGVWLAYSKQEPCYGAGTSLRRSFCRRRPRVDQRARGPHNILCTASYCILQHIYRLPLTVRHIPRTTYHAPRTTHHTPRTTHHTPHTAHRKPHVTCHMSHTTCCVLRTTCYIRYAICSNRLTGTWSRHIVLSRNQYATVLLPFGLVNSTLGTTLPIGNPDQCIGGIVQCTMRCLHSILRCCPARTPTS